MAKKLIVAKKPTGPVERQMRSEWNKIMDDLFEADKASPYLGQTVEEKAPPPPKK